MAQIVPKSNFAAELGTGIGTGLSRLAENKIAQLQQRQQAAKFQPFVQDQETADWIQGLRPQDQLKALQWLQASNTPAAQQFQQQLQPARQQVDELAAPEQFRSSAQPFLQQLGGVPQNLQVQQQQPLPQNLVQQRQLADQLRVQQEQAGMAQRAMQQQQPQQQVQPQAPQSNLPSLKKALAAGARQANPQNMNLNKVQEGYVKAYDTAHATLGTLDRMQELLDSGQVRSGFVKGNTPYSFLSEAEQEFADLGADLASNLATSGQFGNPTNAKIKFVESLKPNLSKKEAVNRRNIDRLRKEALNSKQISQQRLPAGYFGEEEAPQQRQQVQRQPDRVEQKQAEPQKSEESVAKRVFEESPDNLNWFAKKAREEEQQGPKEEGWFDYFVRNIQRGGAKAQESLFGKQEDAEEGFERIENLTGGKHKFSPEQKAAIKRLEKKNDILMQPESFTEEVSDRMFESLPLIGLTGIKGAANIGKALLQDLGASVASTATKEAGGGAGAQLIASLAGGASARKLQNYFSKGGNVKDLMSIAKKAETDAYSKSKELGKNINVEGRDYKKKLTDVHEALQESSALDFADKEETLRKFNQWIGDVSGNKISAEKILERKRDINAIYNKSPHNAKPFLTKAKNVMLDQLERIGSNHKEFDSAWKRGDYLHGAVKYPEQFEQAIADIPKVGKYIKNPLAYALVSGAVGLGKSKSLGAALSSAGTGLAAGVPLALTVKAVEKNWPKIKLMGQFVMAQDPKVRDLALEVTRNVIENNKGNLQRSLIKLSKATEPYSELI